jgi:tetratricopeptide (TPR) repeat protein
MRNSTLRGLIKKLARVVDGAMMSADFTHYFNAGSSLAVYDTELAGLIAAAGDEGTRSTALNHFMSARDKQGVPSLMMPPLVLSAMENRIGDYYHSVGRHANAYEAYYQGLQRYPHNMASLVGIQQALINLGQADEARRVGQHIELVKKNNR